MYFKRIELNGFKSFADPVTIEFTDGITCIVGPNGSGKSNISDAIRWVLGEQSPKTLRGGKMEEVIFAGTQSRRPKGMAEVTLVIDNTNHSLPIDFAEVGITRRMYRSGESEYMINRTPCRLRDIRELIMDTGIGVEGYSVIGQGKISDIIDNKMDSRREIFEEAAGVVKYRTRKAEAQRKLDSASLNLDRVNDIVREIEGRIGGLKEDSEKASEYLELREKYKDIEVNIILKNIEAADEKNKAADVEIEELQLAVATAENTRNALDIKLREAKEKSNELEMSLNNAREALIRVNGEMNRIASSFDLNRERRASLEREKARLEEDLEILEGKIEREKGNLEEISKLSSESSKLREKLEKDLNEKVRLAGEFAERTDLLTDKTEEYKNRIFELSGEYGKVSAEKQSILGMVSALSLRKQRLLDDEGASRAEEEGMADKLKAAAEKRNALSEKVNSEAAEAQALREKRRDLIKKQAEASFALEDLRVAAGKINARDKLLEELENAYEGYSGGVRFIMKQNMRGLMGTVGDLITVPKGWEVAIETELGNKLQNIICDTDNDAKKAIAALKLHQAGRVTFLPLESLRPPQPEKAEHFDSYKGFLGIASEKVKAPAGCEKAVEYLLGRVIIVDNIDNALEMSSNNHGPFRFVTLEGDIVNAAGAITGGSVKNNTGNILSRRTEREELKEKAAEISRRIRLAEEEKAKASDEIAVSDEKLGVLEADLKDDEMKLAVLNNEIDQAEELRRESRLSAEKRIAELKDLDAEIEKNSKSAAALDEKLVKIAEEKTEAEKNSTESAKLLEEARAGFENARAEETKARLAAGSIEERLKAASDLESRAKLQVGSLMDEKKLRQQKYEETEDQIRNAETDEDVKLRLSEKAEEKRNIEDELAKLNEERKASLDKVSGIEEERTVMERGLYEQQSRKHEADLRKARFEAQAEALREKLWEEFEMSYAQAADREMADFVMSRAMKESKEYKERMRALGDVNIGAIEEYRQVKERYDFLTSQRADILKAMDELQTVIKDMDSTIKIKYKKSFDEVVENFENIFAELFNGGHARLTMQDPDNPLESGVEIEAQPPGKKLQNLNLLSGGEKTMTAIALMFAVLKAKPTPFCILDEVEAALDDANIDRFADYLNNFSQTQFALITHQKATMEHAGSLYGVTMPEHGVTKILSLKLGDDFRMD